ncbi:MAG TPA: hypothetical protein VFA98_08295 [Thermoanaerobaculia bacterium]|jgi:hypothetical protein|nr:hypothetical protein [Thermoanaerobaculia bacterium]
MAEEEFEEEEIEEEAPKFRPRAGRAGASRGGALGGASEILGKAMAFASRHRVPLVVGGGFLLFYWVGHRRGTRAAEARARPVTQIYLPPHGGGYRTGIQSTSMYDPRFYDYPDAVDAY